MQHIYEVIVYIYETSMEAHHEKWKWLSLDGEKPDREIATHLYYTIQKVPACPNISFRVGAHEIHEENNTSKFRYMSYSQADSNALEHLEHIVNGYEEENGALLYLLNENVEIAQIAENIVKHGRTSIVWEYSQYPDRYVA
jgi:hypothetical protein